MFCKNRESESTKTTTRVSELEKTKEFLASSRGAFLLSVLLVLSLYGLEYLMMLQMLYCGPIVIVWAVMGWRCISRHFGQLIIFGNIGLMAGYLFLKALASLFVGAAIFPYHGGRAMARWICTFASR